MRASTPNDTHIALSASVTVGDSQYARVMAAVATNEQSFSRTKLRGKYRNQPCTLSEKPEQSMESIEPGLSRTSRTWFNEMAFIIDENYEGD